LELAVFHRHIAGQSLKVSWGGGTFPASLQISDRE
jgi:hypothetical protein